MAAPTAPGDNKNVPYYLKDISRSQVLASNREVLEKYSGVPPEKVVEHVTDIRERAWEIFPYPCVGLVAFLEPYIAQRDNYSQIVESIKAGSKYLEVACGFGQDIRRLFADGAPASNLKGIDIEKRFIDLGCDLFCDHEKLKNMFIVGDVTKDSPALSELMGKIDIIHSGLFFHLFSFPDQKILYERMTKILSPKKGSLLMAVQLGAKKAREVIVGKSLPIYAHDEQSIVDMWKDISQHMGVEWKVKSEFLTFDGDATIDLVRYGNPDAGVIIFSVERMN